jgi:uncharacterized protein YmfQ (DUF2313 family)
MAVDHRQFIAFYRQQLQQLKPRGMAWPTGPDANQTLLFDGLAVEYARVHGRGLDLLAETNPRTTLELLPEWERFAGLPDECSALVATTIQERRLALETKLTSRGGQSKAYFQGVAEKLGYQVEIEQFRPFIFGISQFGVGAFNGDHTCRFYWRVRVLGPRVTWFRFGESEFGVDCFGKITRAEDLECVLRKKQPDQGELLFAYEGA